LDVLLLAVDALIIIEFLLFCMVELNSMIEYAIFDLCSSQVSQNQIQLSIDHILAGHTYLVSLIWQLRFRAHKQFSYELNEQGVSKEKREV